jgi:hypothetical protein
MLQTIFGLTLPIHEFPLGGEQAQALADRIKAAALKVRGDTRAALAAELRRDAEQYLAARREHTLRLPFPLARACDEGARDVMRLTLNAPPMLRRAELLVA